MHYFKQKQYLSIFLFNALMSSATFAQSHCPEVKPKTTHLPLKRVIYICGIKGAGEGIHIEALPSKECRDTNLPIDSLNQIKTQTKKLFSINLDKVDLIPGVRVPLVTSGYMATDCIKDSIEALSCRDYYYKSIKLGSHKIGTLCDLSSTRDLEQRDPIALALGEPQFMKASWSWSPIVNSKRKIADVDFCLYGIDSSSSHCSEQPIDE